MKQLEKVFVSLGYHHTQLHRERKIALYKRLSVNPRDNIIEEHPTINYEVIKIQDQEADTITVDNVSFEIKEKEVYPKGHDWGSLGFSFSKYFDAKKHFDKLLVETADEKLKVTLDDIIKE